MPRNDNPTPWRSDTQNFGILKWLAEHPMQRISSYEALKMFGTMKLATRISEIYNQTGYYAQRELVSTTNYIGKKVAYETYWFTPEQAKQVNKEYFSQL